MTGFETESFRLQQTNFAVLNLFVLAALLLLHTLFSQVLGNPSPLLLMVLGAAFLVKLLEALWLQSQLPALFASATVAITGGSIGVNLGLALLLTFLTNREESPYFVLLALPVLQAAYHFRLPVLLTIIVVADSMMFFWVWHFATFHPPVHTGEYLEAGVISLIYTLVGLLVWSLVNRIRRDQDKLNANLHELEKARKRLANEEKLAAVGRFSSAIAHEIRNPVAMITSSMATAESPGITSQTRDEMYAIAAAEASRLEKLTSDFLTYARPSTPTRVPVDLSELLGYIGDVAKPHASRRGIGLVVEATDELHVDLDAGQIQRALLNLVMNAIDASEPGSDVRMRADLAGDEVQIQVENVGGPIRDEVLSNIFEPFYTTKPQGTGLGLAIARNIARSHGGDLCVACNEHHKVCFAMTLKGELTHASTGGTPHGQSVDRR